MLLISFVGMCRAAKNLSPPMHIFPAEVQPGGTLLLVSDSKHGSFLQPCFPSLSSSFSSLYAKVPETSGPGAALYGKNLKKKIDLNGKRHGDSNFIKEKLFHSFLS